MQTLLETTLAEGWGDIVNIHEPYTEDYGDETRRPSQIGDRADGRFFPIYENEQQLANIRGIGQFIAQHFPAAINISQSLTNYTIGKGFTYTAEARSESASLLADDVQQVIDNFCHRNAFCGDLERELHIRSREDGEFFLALLPDRWQTRAEVMEPAAITEPANAKAVERWLNTSGDASWSFGIHTRGGSDQAIGYHVAYDSAGSRWNYFPADSVRVAHRVKSGLIAHFKRGYRNAKRGVSEFYAVRKFLSHADTLLDNAAHGAKIQAAIAYIVQHATGIDKTQVAAAIAGQSHRRVTENTPAGSRVRNERRIEPGKVLHTPRGTNYVPAPMASTSAPNYMVIEQALLRMAGIRWAMPEYMVSGDASNANYSSTLVAESPFVKAREADQIFYASSFRQIMWKAVRIAHSWGYFSRRNISFDQLQKQVHICVTPPEVATRNKFEDAKTKEILLRNGVITRDVWASEIGY